MPKHTTRNPEARAFHIAEREARMRWERSSPFIGECVDYFGETVEGMLLYAQELKGGSPLNTEKD